MIFASPNADIPTGGVVIKENINEEAQHVRELLEQEMKEKEQLQQLIESLEIDIKSKEKLILQKDQQINLKNATIEDLKVGLTIFETKVKQLEQRVADLSKPQPTPSPQPVQQIAPQPVQQTKPAPQPAQQTKPAPQLHERNDNVLKLSGGYEDTERKTAVREAFEHAWGSYRKYAWGMDELKPVSKSSYNWLGLGVTIIDSLDTLWIMDLKDEFTDARNWIDEHLSFDINRDVSVFETTIRELGGLLSAYEFSRDRMFLDKAEDLARRLLASFNTKTNLPNGSVNLKTMTSRPLSWTGGASILSEIGTLQLEFLYLAYHTNNPQYAIKPLDVFKHLDSLEKDRGLYNLYVDVNSGNMRGSEISLGALGDSFYEYMVKLWLFTNKQFNGYSRMYQESSVGIKEVLVQTTPSGYRYVAQVGRSGRVEYKMEHLTCFSGGMFALGAMHNINPEFVSDDIQLGADITESCHESYTRTKTHIGPEYFEFHGSQEFVVPDRGRHYLLRPETVESYFILWRTTHDPKYRDWAWEAFQAIEQYCRLEGGYSGLQNVDSEHPGYDDLQQSFFLAETLKYLYLIFTDDDVVPLDKYVFNTEAHPLGIITDPIDSWPQELRFHLIEF